MPHLNWQEFKGGIMKFARKNKREKEQATGSLGVSDHHHSYQYFSKYIIQ